MLVLPLVAGGVKGLADSFGPPFVFFFFWLELSTCYRYMGSGHLGPNFDPCVQVLHAGNEECVRHSFLGGLILHSSGT